MAQIANFKHYRSQRALDEAFGAGNWMYVGRANGRYGLSQSALANPYNRRDHGGKRNAIRLYRRWLWRKIQEEDAAVMDALRVLATRPDTVLVCWCHPDPCHSQVIRRAVRWLRERGGKTT